MKPIFKVGDIVELYLDDGCPYDEQDADEMLHFIKVCRSTDKIKTVKYTKDAGWICYTELFGELHEDWLQKPKE